MLSVAKLSGNLDYYLELATLDYYNNGGEPVGKWFGQGAERLNLRGEIDPEVIRRIAAGFSADGQRKLVQNAGKENRQIGWDLTFSAPKSVSVLWSVASPEDRAEIQKAQDEAVRATISYLEEGGASRIGKQGQDQKMAQLVVGLFEHGSSRANDPQLHTHALVLNVGVDSEGETRTILSKPFFQQKMTAGALYRTELAHQLVKRLGVRLERSGFAFEVKGVPKSLCEFHSKRRQEVLTALLAAGQSSAKAAQIAALETRSQKNTLARSQLFEKWQEEAKDYSFSTRNVKRITGHKPVRQRPPKAVDSGFRYLSGKHSYFSGSEVLREAALRSQAEGVSLARVRSATEQFLINDKRVHKVKGTYFTSQKNLKEEKALLESAKSLSRVSNHKLGVESLVAKLLDPSTATLNWEQSAAVAHMTIGNESIALVNGKAGTGKTRMLKTAANLWKDAGYDVLGLCVAGKASRGLHEATGIQTETVAKFLYDAEPTLKAVVSRHLRGLKNAALGKRQVKKPKTVKIGSKSVLVIDEAAMIGTHEMCRILREVERAKAKVVLVGDAKQLQPIAPGNPFQALLDRLGAIQLDEIQRQHDAFDRQMVKDLSEGNVQDALMNLAERDLIHCADDRASAIKQLVQDWGASRDSNSLILAPSRLEVTEINRQCQKLRQARGMVKNGIGLKLNGQTIQVGDRVQFGQRDRKRGLENGDFGFVEQANRIQSTLTVRMDSGRKVLVPIKHYSAIQLGYATTVHKGQGTTVDRAFVLLGGQLQDHHLSYVQLSRARGETRVYIDRFEAGQDYADLIASMERDRQRTLAIDLAKIQDALSQSQSP